MIFNNKFVTIGSSLLLLLTLNHQVIASTRQINGEGLNLIKSFEGWRPNFYYDSVGVKTIGYGHACIPVSSCNNIHPPLTVAQGEKLLRHDIIRFETCVERIVPKMDNDKFAALVSFAYNLGCGALESSSLAKYARAHNYKAAANEFPKWCHAGGKVLQGLVKRRAAERKLFCKSGGC
ncbi:lysozyme RrrD-like [Dermatophagoides farinae]|uniref:lysozyme RrrD-like n=1 Tax=Dermatophagoides farinae TaxID=6954 RepID=UPI003F5D87CA